MGLQEIEKGVRKCLGVGWELAYIEDKMIDVGIAVGWIPNELAPEALPLLASGYGIVSHIKKIHLPFL